MTSRAQIKLAYDMQTLGIGYGQTIARLAVERFPDGFDNETGEEIQKIVKTALDSVLDTLANAGARKSLRKTYECGFDTGVINTFASFARECGERANLELTVG
jgi:hypothetical protein